MPERDVTPDEQQSWSSDPLRGPRRKPGLLALRKQMDRCRRTTTRLVVGFLDVDGLKAVNDTRGHAAGDDLLQRVVARLQSSLRSYETIIRFGGDEFLFTLTDRKSVV